jgi:hypothetical protein
MDDSAGGNSTDLYRKVIEAFWASHGRAQGDGLLLGKYAEAMTSDPASRTARELLSNLAKIPEGHLPVADLNMLRGQIGPSPLGRCGEEEDQSGYPFTGRSRQAYGTGAGRNDGRGGPPAAQPPPDHSGGQPVVGSQEFPHRFSLGKRPSFRREHMRRIGGCDWPARRGKVRRSRETRAIASKLGEIFAGFSMSLPLKHVSSGMRGTKNPRLSVTYVRLPCPKTQSDRRSPGVPGASGGACPLSPRRRRVRERVYQGQVGGRSSEQENHCRRLFAGVTSTLELTYSVPESLHAGEIAKAQPTTGRPQQRANLHASLAVKSDQWALQCSDACPSRNWLPREDQAPRTITNCRKLP